MFGRFGGINIEFEFPDFWFETFHYPYTKRERIRALRRRLERLKEKRSQLDEVISDIEEELKDLEGSG